MKLEVLRLGPVDERSFVKFWSGLYRYSKEPIYIDNIDKPLRRERVFRLFEFKNGGDLSEKKRSAGKGYLDGPRAPSGSDGLAFREYLNLPGGAIWRIFWLHIQRPKEFPIFDQHVYRAMAQLSGLPLREIPSQRLALVEAYLNQYVPFWQRFRHRDKRELDQALWAYGKFLKNKLLVGRSDIVRSAG